MIADGSSLIIYPEGGRSPDGWGQDFKGGAAYLSTRTGAPIIPVHIDGTGEIFGKGASKLSPGRTTVLFGTPLTAAEGENTRRFNERIEAAVTRLGDETLTDWWTATRNAASGRSPKLSGPDHNGWRRQWHLGEKRRISTSGIRRRRRSPLARSRLIRPVPGIRDDPADCAPMTSAPRLLLTLAALALAGAGCTQQESATPVSPAPTTAPIEASTTSVAPPVTEPPVTEPPEPTAPETTTTVPPTTTPPPSGTPSSTSTQFFGGGDPDGWLYLGRWTGNAWESALDDDQQPRQPAIATDDVLIHEIDVEPIPGTVGATVEACSDGRTGPVISPNARAPEEPGFGYRSIAFAAEWTTQPRQIALVDAQIDSYAAAGVAAFEGTGVDAAGGTIQQIVVTDLDGDGDDESLVTFGGSDFSALLLIDADSGRSLTVARDNVAVAPTDTGATTETTEPADPSSETYRTLAVADLNGDGLMEFIVHAWEDADATVIVNSYDGTEVTAVLTAGC